MAGYQVPHFPVNSSVLKVAVQVTHHVADGFAVCMRGPVDPVGAESSQRGAGAASRGAATPSDSTSGGSCTVRSAPGSSAAMSGSYHRASCTTLIEGCGGYSPCESDRGSRQRTAVRQGIAIGQPRTIWSAAVERLGDIVDMYPGVERRSGGGWPIV